MKWLSRWAFISAVCVLWTLSGCPTEGADPTLSGESHWLQVCVADQDCGDDGLSCVCGTCTARCDDDGVCQGEGRGGVCATSDGDCQSVVCASPCLQDGDCASPGDRCLNGVCRRGGGWSCDGAVRREALGGDVTRLTGAVALLRGPVSAGCGQAGRSFSGTYCQREGAVADLIMDGDDIQHVVCTPGRSAASSSGGDATPRGGARVVALSDQVVFASDIVGDKRRPGDVILGLGALRSTVEGSLRIDGPRARLRDLTLIGDLRAEVNSSGLALVDVRVFGDLTLEGTSPTLIGCEIMGDVVVGKRRGVYADVRVAGQWIAPDPVVCVGCASVTPFEPSDATTSDALSNLCAP